MIAQLLRATPLAAVLAAAAFSLPAQAHVSWSLGISAPIAPGVAIGIGAGRPFAGAYIAPAPVYYEPAPVYYGPPPPVYYAPPRVYAPAPVVYGPPVYVTRHPHYYRPPVIYRPAVTPVVMRPGHRGPYGPVATAR